MKSFFLLTNELELCDSGVVWLGLYRHVLVDRVMSKMRIMMQYSCLSISFIWPIIAKQQHNESVGCRPQRTASAAERKWWETADKLRLSYLDKVCFYCLRRLLEQKRNSLSSNFQFNYLRKKTHSELNFLCSCILCVLWWNDEQCK